MDDLPYQTAPVSESASTRSTRLSYKFQRLRERLREAIRSGELSGKLPGERQLAQQFEVNAKTLSKALTDLAAEGLLDRTVGRGTFVRGTESSTPSASAKPLLFLVHPNWIQTPLTEFTRSRTDATIRTLDFAKPLRPSYLARYRGVVAVAASTDQPVLSDIAVRAMPLVLIAQEPKTMSVNAVLFDRDMAIRRVARELLLRGHTRFFGVESQHAPVMQTLRAVLATTGGSHVTLDGGDPDEAVAAYRNGATAIITASAAIAALTLTILSEAGIRCPRDLTLAGVGGVIDEPPCGGVFIRVSEIMEAAVRQIDQPLNSRPQTLWLTGQWNEGSTIEQFGQPNLTRLRGFGDLIDPLNSVR